ncbi:hypothetical protein HPP92_016255 [Vanilla planifolia]|uniref:O-fucosyltransferase family protein n=1 Tax=Vanilla planifolia TaxID=51239 RepID=A0A835UR32_VANPL|nr:hypothetical protein HPP92_016255 [Vanilla planifolia]
MSYLTSPSPLTLSGARVRTWSRARKSETIGARRRRLKDAMMKPLCYRYHSQRVLAYAALVVLLLPALWPTLFSLLLAMPLHTSSRSGTLLNRDTSLLKGKPVKSSGYIQVFLDGGLNQQRMGICDAVAVAKILNATLVIPYLEVNPVWKDSSSFEEIYDVDHFINALKEDISVVRELPPEYAWSTREYYAVAIRTTRIKTAPVHASANWYLENVLPVLQSYGIAAIAPFSHRLAFDNLPVDLQRLRCKVNFQALAFVPHIINLGETLVKRLKHQGRVHSNEFIKEVVDDKVSRGSGKYLTLHLRFDKDMAAHSACDFGGGKAERLALAKYRQVIWQGRVMNSQFTDEELRSRGRCPLTPEEIGLLLAALGFDNQTRLYLASHKVYGGESRISSLRKLFPLMEDKKSLASSEELSMVDGSFFSSQPSITMSACTATSSSLPPQATCIMLWLDIGLTRT